MKSLRLSFFAFASFLGTMSVSSCGNSCSEENINDEAAKVTNTAADYSTYPTNTTACEAYKTALEDYL